MKQPLTKPPFRLARTFYKLFRGATRVLTIPVRRLPEGNAKSSIRRFVLRFQHSLPTELVVNAGDTVVQVGTPNPRTMARFARAVGEAGRLIIVEAMPDNQARLEQAIREGGHHNVSLIKAAACNENGAGELAVSPFWGDHRIPLADIAMDNDRKAENQNMPRIPVRFVRLDDALDELGVSGNRLSIRNCQRGRGRGPQGHSRNPVAVTERAHLCERPRLRREGSTHPCAGPDIYGPNWLPHLDHSWRAVVNLGQGLVVAGRRSVCMEGMSRPSRMFSSWSKVGMSRQPGQTLRKPDPHRRKDDDMRTLSLRRNVLWSLVGNIVYNLTQWLLLVALARWAARPWSGSSPWRSPSRLPSTSQSVSIFVPCERRMFDGCGHPVSTTG